VVVNPAEAGAARVGACDADCQSAAVAAASDDNGKWLVTSRGSVRVSNPVGNKASVRANKADRVAATRASSDSVVIGVISGVALPAGISEETGCPGGQLTGRR
jgi:hypothetical protein